MSASQAPPPLVPAQGGESADQRFFAAATGGGGWSATGERFPQLLRHRVGQRAAGDRWTIAECGGCRTDVYATPLEPVGAGWQLDSCPPAGS